MAQHFHSPTYSHHHQTFEPAHKMARLTVAMCMLAAICCAAVAAAADPKLMVPDTLVSSKSTKARTSNYYDDTELACMNQMNFKNCRYTGCPVDRNFLSDTVACAANNANTGTCQQCAPDSIYFQTDFTCCNKEHSYGNDNHHDIGLAFNDKVGTCDWEISMYRSAAMQGSTETESTDPVDPWAPHPTDDGTAIKWGTAWGTCYLNAEAEHCGSPLCERMAINIQGGLYATCAYSTDKTTSAAQFQDTCNSAGITGSVNWNEFNLQQVLTYLQVQSLAELGATCFGASFGGRRLQSTDAKTEEYHHETHTYYPGVALVLSGPMHVTAKKDHKLEETGMFEQTISFVAEPTDTTGVTDVVQHWPIVTQKSTKIRFTREHEEYYQGGSQ